MAATAVEGGLGGRPLPRVVLPDTNILLLWIVALHDETLVPRFKRTAQFTVGDARLLTQMMRRFRSILTTPNVLTETSNFLGQLAQPAQAACRRVMRERLEVLDERYVPSRDAAAEPMFEALGLTDAGLLHLQDRQTLLLSDDYRLVGAANARGLSAVNFNHLRSNGSTFT